jgi:hypothetical protein
MSKKTGIFEVFYLLHFGVGNAFVHRALVRGLLRRSFPRARMVQKILKLLDAQKLLTEDVHEDLAQNFPSNES